MAKRPIRDYLALGISAVFHPLLIPSYMLIILLIVNPFLFGVSSIWEGIAMPILLLIFLYTCVVPFISVTIMWGLGMVKNLHLEDRMERIGPYLLVLILYMWIYFNFARRGTVPVAYATFMLGIVIALSISFVINVFNKISAHAVGMGGLVAMVLITMLLFGPEVIAIGNWTMSLSLLLMLVIAAAGLVGTSRLVLKAHVSADIYGGYLVGFVSQLIALRYYF
ncbi:MAG: hypothetical protein AAFQ37_13015 [Bacteroidota bacterium]